ncbi:transposase InsO family protein [Methylorubrum extorquens]|nr:transposase InsO family protein [Methylorubrum extorquens]MCP1591705.1 transposase InsO family protein [Methylorubrum extorquens]
MSERRSCVALGVGRSSIRYRSTKSDQAPLRMRICDLAKSRVRYGYFRIYILLRREGWRVNHKRVHRLYRDEGLSLRLKRPRRELCGRLGDDGVLKAAYRGGCRSLPEPLSESDTPWRHLPTSSGFVSPKTSTIP